MKPAICLLLFVVVAVSCAVGADDPSSATSKPPDTTQSASKAGEKPKFEMQTYYMVFLRRGPNWTAEQTDEVKRIGEGHMAHIVTYADSGYIALAGPFLEQGETPGVLAGIVIYRVDSKETARRMAELDPAVKAGRFTIEILPWLGPKSLRY